MQEFFQNMSNTEATLWYIGVPSTIVFVVMMILTMIGVDSSDGVSADFDSDLDSGSDLDEKPFQLLGFRNLVAFLTMFSWVGLGCYHAGMSPLALVVWATFSGLAFVIALTSIFYFFFKMQQDNTPRSKDAVGKIATVYLQVPPRGQGTGKIQVNYGGAIRELNARTESTIDYPTNSQVKVLSIENGVAVVGDPAEVNNHN